MYFQDDPEDKLDELKYMVLRGMYLNMHWYLNPEMTEDSPESEELSARMDDMTDEDMINEMQEGGFIEVVLDQGGRWVTPTLKLLDFITAKPNHYQICLASAFMVKKDALKN